MPSRSDRTPVLLSAFALALLMAATRFHHFGSALNLPDASVAVFFLAGFLLSWWWFPAFALFAAGIDYAAIAGAGASGYCVTPAYAFLLPTYAVMTFAGRWARRHRALGLADFAPLAAAAVLAAAVAFVVSNGSFYLFSNYFASLSYADYLVRTGRYAIPYISWTLFYVAAGLAVVKFAPRLRAVARA